MKNLILFCLSVSFACTSPTNASPENYSFADAGVSDDKALTLIPTITQAIQFNRGSLRIACRDRGVRAVSVTNFSHELGRSQAEVTGRGILPSGVAYVNYQGSPMFGAVRVKVRFNRACSSVFANDVNQQVN